jgi:hypothetical protein
MHRYVSRFAAAIMLAWIASTNAEAAEREATAVLAGSTLYGIEFSLDLCRAAPGDYGCYASSSPTNLYPVWCEDAHTKWSPWYEYDPHNPFAERPEFELSYPNGSISAAEAQYCEADYAHSSTTIRPDWGQTEEVSVEGYADHVRSAFVRGGVDLFAWGPAPLTLTLRIEQHLGSGWSTVATRDVLLAQLTRQAVEITGYVAAGAATRLRVTMPYAWYSLYDTHMFVEQCLPDFSRPGKCIGDPDDPPANCLRDRSTSLARPGC